MDRNKFLKYVGALGAASLLPDLSFGLGMPISKKHPIFDLHCHTGRFFAKGNETYPGDGAFSKSVSEMNLAGVKGVFISIVSDSNMLIRTDKGIEVKETLPKGMAWETYKIQLEIFQNLIQNQAASIGYSSKDINKGMEVKFFLSCEGADFVEEDIDRIDEVYESGVRSVQLVHYVPNNVGDLQTADPLNGGLSDYGKSIVKRLTELGIVIDLAHASFDTVKGVAEATGAPLLLSHSILADDPNRPIAVRALSRDHAKLIAETGGLIGAWPSGFSKDFDDFVENTLRLIDAVGVDHVGIGTDMDANFNPVINDYFGVERWLKALSTKGFSKSEVQKIGGGNAKRLLEQVLKG
ncbi:dipeptidase [Algoriphagus sp.]|uniref:dipeptidase n=1 Tax=Algoriphagus sp. TaxID=1872435 RepID=UPI00391AE3E9